MASETNSQTYYGEVALPCTASKRGLWTLWWRYEFLRAQIEALDSDTPMNSSAAPMPSRVVEREVIFDEMQWVGAILEVNGAILI